MLARPRGQRDVSGDDWVHEFKWDGIRVLATVDDGHLSLVTRNGNDVAVAWPELAPLADVVPDETTIDGEIVVLDDRLRPDFSRIANRMHVRDELRIAELRRTHPGQFMAFDLLEVAGSPIVDDALEQRRDRLTELLAGDTGAWAVPPTVKDLDTILAVVAERGLEGIVSKRWGSRYEPGVRSRNWRKWRRVREVDAVVVGHRGLDGATTGPVTSMALARRDPETATWVPMGSVGSGLTEAEGLRLRAEFDAVRDTARAGPGPAQGDEHTTAGTEGSHAEGTRAADGLVPEGFTATPPRMVVRVRYLEATPWGHLRHPVYLGQRRDAHPHDITEAP